MVSLPHLTMIPSSEESRMYCTPLAINALAASAEAAVVREVQEELEITPEIIRPL